MEEEGKGKRERKGKKMMKAGLMESPYTFGQLKTNPNLLKKLVERADEDRMLYFPSGIRFVVNPQEVAVGAKALEYVSLILDQVQTSGPTPSEDVAIRFQALTGVSLDLFVGIPSESYPATHPFQTNGALKLLEEYRGSLQKPNYVSFRHQMGVQNHVCLGMPGSPSSPLIKTPFLAGVKRHFSTKSSLDALLKDFMPGFRVAYDLYDNIWISIQTLLGLLTGTFYVNNIWISTNEMFATRSLNEAELNKDLFARVMELNCQSLILLKDQGIHWIISDYPYLDNGEAWKISDLENTATAMQEMIN